ncbi:MAG: hypothetical protein V9E99_18060 [Microthrixaceae bacterium]|jgi:hypothetical protein|nr:hypothetical protein [Microthrixaceae bacterium]
MASNPKVKPSVAGIWIGIILMLLGMGSCVGGPVLGVYSLVSQLSDADRYPVGTPQSFTFEDSAAGMIFGIAATGTDAAQVDVTLTNDSTGDVVVLEDSTNLTGESGTDNGEAYEFVGAFGDAPSGTYTMQSSGPAGAEVVLLNISPSSLVTKIVGGIGVGALLGLIGLIVLIVTATRRSKAKKAARAFVPIPAPVPASGPPVGYPQPPGAAAPAAYPPQSAYPPPPSAGAPYPPAAPAAPPTYPPAPSASAPSGYPPPPSAPGTAPSGPAVGPPPIPPPPAPVAPSVPDPSGFPPPPAPVAPSVQDPSGFPPPPAPDELSTAVPPPPPPSDAPPPPPPV